MSSRVLRLWFCSVLVAILASCGFGPLGTCRTPCKLPEVRDSFCGCGLPTQSPFRPGPPGGDGGPPYLSFQWAESEPSCGSLNREYYIFNPGNKAVEAWVSWRESETYRTGDWFYAAPHTTSYSSAKRLGLEGDEPGCFDKDFVLGTWRDPKTKMDAYEEHFYLAKGLNINDKNSLSRVQDFPKASPELDCQKLCTTNPISASCLMLNPADSTAADETRAKVLKEMQSGSPNWNEAMEPLLRNNEASCARQKVETVGNKVINTGESCAYPFTVNKADPKPSTIVHLPSRISAEIKQSPSAKELRTRSLPESPFIAFRSTAISDDYGGYITAVSADANSIYYQTSAPACIALRTQ